MGGLVMKNVNFPLVGEAVLGQRAQSDNGLVRP